MLYIYSIIIKINNMKKVNEFKKFLDENVNEIKNLLVNSFDYDEDDVSEIVSFEDDDFGGFIGCDEEGFSVVGGCNLYKNKIDDEDVSVEVKVVNDVKVYFVLYDF